MLCENLKSIWSKLTEIWNFKYSLFTCTLMNLHNFKTRFLKFFFKVGEMHNSKNTQPIFLKFLTQFSYTYFNIFAVKFFHLFWFLKLWHNFEIKKINLVIVDDPVMTYTFYRKSSFFWRCRRRFTAVGQIFNIFTWIFHKMLLRCCILICWLNTFYQFTN